MTVQPATTSRSRAPVRGPVSFDVVSKMKFVIGALTGAVVVAGILFIRQFLAPHEVLASSISPDSKWICEIVDIDPRGPVCEILIHGQSYEGLSKLKRGYRGECIVMDLDSGGPPDVKFDWSGPVVTIRSQRIGDPVKLRCEKEGAVIIRDDKQPTPDK
jgi:hypothetical protein